MPENTVKVSRPSKWGNPFRVGGYFKIGGQFGNFRMSWCEAVESHAGPDYTRIEDAAMAVAFYERLLATGYCTDFSELRGKNLACWCGPGPCHADVLLRLANPAADPGDGAA